MAGLTYYYFFSIILVLGGVYLLGILLYLRSKRYLSTTKYRPGTSEYARLRRLFGVRTLGVVGGVTLLLTLNLGYAIYKIARTHTQDTRFLLVFAPVVTTLLFVYMHSKLWNKMLSSSELARIDKSEQKKDDSWLV